MARFFETEEHLALLDVKNESSLKLMMEDEARVSALQLYAEGLTVDASRSLMTAEEWTKLCALYEHTGVSAKLEAMFKGDKVNFTEKRAVGHAALRQGTPDNKFVVDGHDYAPDVAEVKGRIYKFAESVREGKYVGFTGKKLDTVVCIGIGGSYLGIEFVHEALRTYVPTSGQDPATGRKLRFLANVDPIDSRRALEGLCAETTLVVVASKTFTTAETMLNAKTVREWVLDHYKYTSKDEAGVIGKHFCAVSTNIPACKAFGIKEENIFGFWDWVGGRFSVCSSVGLVPLSLQYGEQVVEEFLGGCRAIDQHVYSNRDKPQTNLAALMALVSFYNASYKNLDCVAILPYCQSLLRFPAHIQQLLMESNGKKAVVAAEGYEAYPGATTERYSGEIYFGEPGTNGQHSFYQLVHQGRVVPCEFIGFTQSQNPVHIKDCPISHDELMSNFFAQPDALALGKTREQLQQENCPEELIPHKTFSGNRPSVCLLFDGALTPAAVGKLLALYEHRVAVEGFLWGINSFDQWGVELGKVLAKNVGAVLKQIREGVPQEKAQSNANLPLPTRKLLERYVAN
ncbi:glucose-6-phosphate isomerase [Gregarina niphandrodes]|uniref:Glucose-6-phosphate isomerase n=1 Tax=Gregarina niphandrodes TaxID=110365 RepID=A0A023B9A5_GRENI|nr:glucose-6-phosphate isomerase [Gregarina niphandrodes]EZG71897.1 glucose-6-phosphate isomerase [Gregarina niphandrodes]|eukprot:XP_011129807.1 glucose-6-phosphate isomerase [Gregarina niphandrodes]